MGRSFSITGPGSRLVFLATSFIAALCAYAFSYPLNHDAAWYLFIAEEMRRGADLYSDIIEVNPPLIAYLSMIPVVLSSRLGTRIEPTFEILVVLLVTAAVTWAWRAVRTEASSGFALVVVVALMLALLGAPGIDFGQREHLMFALTVPYVLVVWRRIEGAEMRVPCALFAGTTGTIGFCLKPHFVLIWLCLEGWLAWRRGVMARRPEFLTVAIVGAGYALIILAAHPGYLELVLAAREMYGSFNRQSLGALVSTPHLIPLGLAALAATRPRLGPAGELARIWIVFGLAAFLVMVLQGKGWTYHQYPMLSSALLAAILLGFEAVSRKERPAPQKDHFLLSAVAVGVALTLVAFVTVHRHTAERHWMHAMLDHRLPFFETLPRGASVVFFSDLFEDAFPLVTIAGVEWASALPPAWWVKPLYAARGSGGTTPARPDDMSAIERRFAETLVNDFARRRPDYVLVDGGRASVFGGRPFPYISYFGQFAVFRSEWENYVRQGRMDRFTIWRRMDSGPGVQPDSVMLYPSGR